MSTNGGRARVDLRDGGHLAYVERGHGPAMLLLHGGMLDHRMWGPQLDSLAAEHRVIAVDARSHGWSSTATQPYRNCDDVAELIHTLDLSPVTLVGISMGAATATDTALEHPELLARLVVSGGGTSEPIFDDPWVVDIMTRMQQASEHRDRPGFIDALMDLTPGPDRTLDDLPSGLVADLRAMAEHTLDTHVGVETDPFPPTPVMHTWERAASIEIPVLAVTGSADSTDHVQMAQRLATTVRDGQVVDIDRAAHYPNLEAPAAFDAAVRDFVKRTRAS